MPKSKIRKKVQATRAYKAEHPEVETFDGPLESPRWLAPAMVGGLIIGLIWIVIFYVSQTQYPIPHIGAWNMLIGFGFVATAFGLMTRWR